MPARLHALLPPPSASLFPTAAIAKLKPGVHLLNFSRAELVDGEALATAINEGVGMKWMRVTVRCVDWHELSLHLHLGSHPARSRSKASM